MCKDINIIRETSVVYSKLLDSRNEAILITDPHTLSINHFIQACNIQKYSEKHKGDKVLMQRLDSAVSCGRVLSNLGLTVSNVQTERLASTIARYYGVVDDANEADAGLATACAVKKEIDEELRRLRKYFREHNKSTGEHNKSAGTVKDDKNNTYQHEAPEPRPNESDDTFGRDVQAEH